MYKAFQLLLFDYNKQIVTERQAYLDELKKRTEEFEEYIEKIEKIKRQAEKERQQAQFKEKYRQQIQKKIEKIISGGKLIKKSSKKPQTEIIGLNKQDQNSLGVESVDQKKQKPNQCAFLNKKIGKKSTKQVQSKFVDYNQVILSQYLSEKDKDEELFGDSIHNNQDQSEDQNSQQSHLPFNTHFHFRQRQLDDEESQSEENEGFNNQHMNELNLVRYRGIKGRRSRKYGEFDAIGDQFRSNDY